MPAKGIFFKCALALLLMHRAAAADSPPAFLGSWGMLGTGPGEFDTPYDVSIGPNGDVFVLDGGNERVEVFTSQGSFIRQWATGAGLYATGYSHLDAIAVNSSGDVYVAGWGFNFHFDSAQPLVARFSTSGAPHGAFLGPEIEGVSFFNCYDVVVAPNGDVVIPVTWTVGGQVTSEGRIMRLPYDLSSFTEWRGLAGSAPGQIPLNVGSIAVDPVGNIFLTDSKGSHVDEFTLDGDFIAQWGVPGTGDSQLNSRWGIAIAPNGNLIIADPVASRLQQFTASGQFVSVWGALGSGPGQTHTPFSVAVDAAGSIYVTDGGNNRIDKFGVGPTPVRSVSFGQLKVKYRP